MVKQGEEAVRRVAIVTGAGTCLGSANPRQQAQHGLRVVDNNRRRELQAAGRGSAQTVGAEILAAGGEAVGR